MKKIVQIKSALKAKAKKDKAEFLPRFFKCGQGQYGEGDIFMGVMVPDARSVAKKFSDLDFADLQILIKSKIHEERLTALFILVAKYEKIKDNKLKKQCIDFYLKNLKSVNNWDLVDLSCYKVLGDWLINRDRKILYTMAKSNDLWQKRIAMISTFAFIRNSESEDTLKIAKILLSDKHDLIHKAVGWMLREMGKRQPVELKDFLDINATKMPRTMLRYAIEKLSEKDRKMYLAKKFDG
ncbi:MAG: DNA alkylation repair protein [bacterium]